METNMVKDTDPRNYEPTFSPETIIANQGRIAFGPVSNYPVDPPLNLKYFEANTGVGVQNSISVDVPQGVSWKVIFMTLEITRITTQPVVNYISGFTDEDTQKTSYLASAIVNDGIDLQTYQVVASPGIYINENRPLGFVLSTSVASSTRMRVYYLQYPKQ